MARSLPPRPSLESLQKQAKQLLRGFQAGEVGARESVQSHHPRPEAFAGLRDAQLALAREYGFTGWAELRDAAEARRTETFAPSELADEFADLACLTYSALESPRRIQRAVRLLERHPDLVEHSVFAAAAAGYAGTVARLLAADPERVRARGGPRGWSPLLYLAYSRVPDALPARSAVATARLLLERGADPDDHFQMHDSYRFTALTGAIGEGEQGIESQPPHAHARELAILLLDAGADPNDGQGLYNSHFTPGNEWLALLLERGLTRSDPMNRDDGDSMRTLDYQLCAAVTRGFAERVELLLRHGADPGAIDPYSKRSVHRNAVREGQEAIRELLVAAGARADELELEDRMHMACRAGDLAALSRLGREHPELVLDPRLLGAAVREGNLAAIRALLELGADVNGRMPGGVTPLHIAARHGRMDAAALLLERGAAIDARDEIYDASPVGWANQFGQLELRDALLDRTRDVFDLAAWARIEQLEGVLRSDPGLASARRARGLTPLHRLDVAGSRGAAAIDLLLRFGADIHARTEDGRTPLDTRVSLELEEIADLLRERGAE